MTQWTCIWANSGRQWRTGKPGVLQSMGLQRIRHDLATAQQQQNRSIVVISKNKIFIWLPWVLVACKLLVVVWGSSSLTRERTRAPCSMKSETSTRGYRESPELSFLLCWPLQSIYMDVSSCIYWFLSLVFHSFECADPICFVLFMPTYLSLGKLW